MRQSEAASGSRRRLRSVRAPKIDVLCLVGKSRYEKESRCELGANEERKDAFDDNVDGGSDACPSL